MSAAETQERQFWDYHEANPEVFKLFRKFAQQMMATGRKRYSAKSIVERIRWHYDVRTTGDDGFKINNNYTSRYAVLLEDSMPEFEGFFQHRGGIVLTYAREMKLEVNNGSSRR